MEWIKNDYSSPVSYIDVSFLGTSRDESMLLDGQVKVHPFDLDKATLIRDTFSKGKVDWATVIIQTHPVDMNIEEDARSRLRKAVDSGQPHRVTTAMRLNKEVESCPTNRCNLLGAPLTCLLTCLTGVRCRTLKFAV